MVPTGRDTNNNNNTNNTNNDNNDNSSDGDNNNNSHDDDYDDNNNDNDSDNSNWVPQNTCDHMQRSAPAKRLLRPTGTQSLYRQEFQETSSNAVLRVSAGRSTR